MKKIAIHSAPRSGSTWLGSIFDSNPNVAFRFQPLFSYTHKSQLGNNSTAAEINKFFKDILNTNDDFVLQNKTKSDKAIPSFPKKEITHIVYKEVRYHHILENLLEKENKIKVIGLIRNPLAVISSWLNANKEFRKDLGWEELKEWRYAKKKNLNRIEEFNGFEKWKEVALLFEKLYNKYPDRFLLINYNKLLEETLKTTQKMFEFSGLHLGDSTIDYIKKSKSIDKSNDVYSVYRTKKKDELWKKNLTKEIYYEILSDLEKSDLIKYIQH